MSVEQAKKLIDRLKSDTLFNEKIMSVQGFDERMELIASEGYDCSIKDIFEYQQSLNSAGSNTKCHVEIPPGAYYCTEIGCGC